jgi:hypothetical protein
MHRSRIAHTLNVPQRVRFGPSLAAALLNGLFEQPARRSLVTSDMLVVDFQIIRSIFSVSG